MPEVDLSVIIPAYNEAQRLGPTLDRVSSYLAGRGIAHEIVVVDDGSRDATAALAASHRSAAVRLVRQPRNLGKGAALRRGVSESRGRRVLLTDADLSTPIEELERLEERLDGGAEVAIGSRGLGDSDVRRAQPLYRELMGRTFNGIIRLLGVRGIADTQCGFKLIEGAAARELFPLLAIDGFAYDVELVWLARRRGLEVAEVGVTWINSPDSRVHPIFDSLAMLRDVVLMRWRHRRWRRR